MSHGGVTGRFAAGSLIMHAVKIAAMREAARLLR